MLPTVSPSVTAFCMSHKVPVLLLRHKHKGCPPWRVTASTGTTAIGFVLQIIRAFTSCALRRSSGA